MRILLILLVVSRPAAADDLTATVAGPKADLKNVIVRVPLAPGRDAGTARLGTTPLPAQRAKAVTLAGSIGGVPDKSAGELVVLLPELKAGKDVTLTLGAAPAERTDAKPALAWAAGVGGRPELSRDAKPLLVYVMPEFDPQATPAGLKANANPTTKPFHHLYAADGKTLLTNGAEGKYPHHRGIFFGFNKCSYGDKKTADVWHCLDGESQAHAEVLGTESGDLFGRMASRIAWHGKDGKTFATEDARGRRPTTYPAAR